MAHPSITMAQAIVDAGEDEQQYLSALRLFDATHRADAILSIAGVPLQSGKTREAVKDDALMKEHREAIQAAIRDVLNSLETED